MSFEALLRPRSVAVVGASANPSKVGHSVLSNLVRDGFQGPIFPINPTAERILDLKCHKSLLDVDGPIDLAIVVVSRDHVMGVLDDCKTKGVSAAIVITAGFGEVGEQGRALQHTAVQKCREGRITMVGPNCLGLVNPWHKLNASFGQPIGEPGAIALVSQSGALMTAVQDLAASTRLGFSLMASIGNKAFVDEVDFLQMLRADKHTKVITAYLENIVRGQEFMKVAERVGKEKPVVILKSGRTAAGAKAASSHTGSLAGADSAYDCAFERCGVIRVDSVERLFDVSQALAHQPLPEGDRIAVVTNAGGPGIMATDAIELLGLKMAVIDEANEAALRKILPAAGSWRNPVDVLGDAGPELYGAAAEVLLASSAVDALMVILTPQKVTDAEGTAKVIAEVASRHSKPVLACFMGGDAVASGISVFRSSSIPQYPIPERAAMALRQMVTYAAYKKRPLRLVERFVVNKNPVIKLFKSYRTRGVYEIGEVDAKTVMRAYNFHLPTGMLADSAEEAVNFAEQMGYPLAMKISSPDILHKSDVGGVRTNLQNASQVADAYELMMLRVKRKRPEAEVRGVLIEQMALGGQEVILGVKRDPQFGPMIMFGLGGIFVEVLKDVTFGVAPLTGDEIERMVERTRSYGLLRGARGREPRDVNSVIESIQRLSQLVVDFPEIEEVDINPLMVGREGDGALVVDARIVVAANPRSAQ
jgi:acetate---CoA ligase (ADP-forming)